MPELWGVKICLLPLTRLIAYTTACCYCRSHDYSSCVTTLHVQCYNCIPLKPTGAMWNSWNIATFHSSAISEFDFCYITFTHWKKQTLRRPAGYCHMDFGNLFTYYYLWLQILTEIKRVDWLWCAKSTRAIYNTLQSTSRLKGPVHQQSVVTRGNIIR